MVTTSNRHISFPSKTENISLVEAMVDSLCEEYGISEDSYGNILVAVTEAVTNAIQHGNKGDSNKLIHLDFEPEGNFLQFAVTDEGTGFDYNQLPDPTDPANLENPHGRGIFLMKHLADDVLFENEGKKVIVKFLAKT